MSLDSGNFSQSSSTKSFSILLAENNLLLQQAMKIALGQKGFKLTMVKNGQEAVDILKQQTFDTVLMDINMPVLNGVDATKTIRLFNAQIPIIAFTSYEETAVLQDIKAAGMNGFLSKYASPEHMFNTIIEHISQQKVD